VWVGGCDIWKYNQEAVRTRRYAYAWNRSAFGRRRKQEDPWRAFTRANQDLRFIIYNTQERAKENFYLLFLSLSNTRGVSSSSQYTLPGSFTSCLFLFRSRISLSLSLSLARSRAHVATLSVTVFVEPMSRYTTYISMRESLNTDVYTPDVCKPKR